MTLIELLIVLSLIAITLFFLPATSYQLTEHHQIITLEHQLTNMIQFSRNIAMASGKNVAINPENGEENWSTGMVLFVDNASHHYTAQDKILHRWRWTLSRDIQLRWEGFQSNDFIVFSSSLKHAICNGHFTIIKHGQLVKQIVVNRLGSSRVVNNE